MCSVQAYRLSARAPSKACERNCEVGRGNHFARGDHGRRLDAEAPRALLIAQHLECGRVAPERIGRERIDSACHLGERRVDLEGAGIDEQAAQPALHGRNAGDAGEVAAGGPIKSHPNAAQAEAQAAKLCAKRLAVANGGCAQPGKVSGRIHEVADLAGGPGGMHDRQVIE